MNDELQSTNEELQTMNDEIRSRGGDLDTANAFLESVLSSFSSAVAVVDREYRVQIWNGGATELWGITSAETVGSNLLALDIGLPVAALREPIREVLTASGASAETTLAGVNRRGRSVRCRVRLAPLNAPGGPDISGVILVMEGGRGRLSVSRWCRSRPAVRPPPAPSPPPALRGGTCGWSADRG